MEVKEILKKAQKLYNRKEWNEAIEIIDKNLAILRRDNDIAQAKKIQGWSYYYKGIKGTEDKKIENLKKAEDSFNTAIKGTREIRISAMNGLPLVFWILGKKEEAWKISEEATKDFPENASIWNTRSILCRWAEDFKKATGVCEKVYKIAEKNNDYRTAGHGKHNQGDAFVKLDEREKALESYQKAEEMYVKDGKSAFHLEAVRDKIRNIEK